MATAALTALRRLYPDAHITWAVGGWSKRAVASHSDCDDILDTGAAANPAAGLRGMWRFARMLRKGGFDLAVSLVRSPWMSAAVVLAGIPHRVGIDSGGRGFGYTVRVPVDAAIADHEAQIYLNVVAALGADTAEVYANVPVVVPAPDVPTPYVVLNPNGGNNPGMQMDMKRWPLENFAAVGDVLAQAGYHLVLVGGPDDHERLSALQAALTASAHIFAGTLSFDEIAALAQAASGYIGNDTGLTHLAAAAGARTVMIMGPSDPARYSPYVKERLVLWHPVKLPLGGVSASHVPSWNWQDDGINADDAIPQIRAFLIM